MNVLRLDLDDRLAKLIVGKLTMVYYMSPRNASEFGEVRMPFTASSNLIGWLFLDY